MLFSYFYIQLVILYLCTEILTNFLNFAKETDIFSGLDSDSVEFALLEYLTYNIWQCTCIQTGGFCLLFFCPEPHLMTLFSALDSWTRDTDIWILLNFTLWDMTTSEHHSKGTNSVVFLYILKLNKIFQICVKYLTGKDIFPFWWRHQTSWKMS